MYLFILKKRIITPLSRALLALIFFVVPQSLFAASYIPDITPVTTYFTDTTHAFVNDATRTTNSIVDTFTVPLDFIISSALDYTHFTTEVGQTIAQNVTDAAQSSADLYRGVYAFVTTPILDTARTIANQTQNATLAFNPASQAGALLPAVTDTLQSGYNAIYNFWGNVLRTVTPTPEVTPPPSTPTTTLVTTPPTPQVAVTPPPTPPTTINRTVVTQPVIERTIERTRVLSGVTATDLATQIADLRSELLTEISKGKTQAVADNNALYLAMAPMNRINNLSSVTISNPVITGASITGTSISGYLPSTGGSLSGDLAGSTGSFTTLGIGTTTPSDTFAVNGVTYLADVSAPAVTTNRLYSNSGSLYWNGSLVGGGAIGNWTASGPDVYRASGKVGIGTTSPYAALSVVGQVVGSYYTATSTTVSGYSAYGGTVTVPTYSFAGSPTTGIYSSGANYIDFSTGGVKRMSITPAGSAEFVGNFFADASMSVGTGVTPVGQFDVISTSATRVPLRVMARTSGQTANLQDWIDSSSNIIGSVTAAGNFGIGTTTPAQSLAVVGNTLLQTSTNSTTAFAVRNAAYNSIFGVDTTGSGTINLGGATNFNGWLNLVGASNGGLNLGSGHGIAWANTTTNVGAGLTGDTGLSRLSAGTLAVGNGTIGNSSGTFIAGNIGVGTTSPYAALSVVGQVVGSYFTATSTTATSTFSNSISISSGSTYRINGVPLLGANSAGAFIGGDQTGNARGQNSVDIVGLRPSATAVASGSFATAIGGYNVTASGAGAVSIGYSSTASNTFSVALGQGNTASGVDATALGFSNAASGYQSTAVGSSNAATAGGASAFGSGLSNGVASSTLIGPSQSAAMIIRNTGNVGIGITNPGSLLTVASTSHSIAADTLSDIASYQDTVVGITNGTGVDQGSHGVNFQTTLSGIYNMGSISSAYGMTTNNATAGTIGHFMGLVGRTNNASSGNVTDNAGFYGDFQNTGSGTTANGYALLAQSPNITAGTVTNAYGVKVNGIASAGGTITNGYGLGIVLPTGATSNNIGLLIGTAPTSQTSSLYVSSGTSYFGGNVGIGTTSPYTALSVVGEVYASKFTAASTTQAISLQEYLNHTNMAAWGDSLTLMAGSPYLSYPADLAGLTGKLVYNGGVSSENSTQIKNRMIAATDKYRYPTIIWAGRNNFASAATVEADIATMVAALTTTNYVVMSIVNGDTATEWSGGSDYNKIIAINNYLATTYGTHYLDIRSYLVTNGLTDAGITPTAQDTIDIGHDVPPASLRLTADFLHYNAAGLRVVANRIFNTKMGVLTPATATVVTSETFPLSRLNGITVGGVNILNASSTIQSTLVGMQAGYNLSTTSLHNVALGFQSLYTSTGLGESYNTAIGAQTLYSLNGGSANRNTAIGGHSMYSNTTGSTNTAVGYNSLFSNLTGAANVALGQGALQTSTGSNNTAAGFGALFTTTANNNTAMGYSALGLDTTGADNTSIGLNSFANLTTGTGNVAVGRNAGIGDGVIQDSRSVIDNYATFLGYRASRDSAVASTTVLTNITALGKNAIVGASNTLILGGIGADSVKVGIGTSTPYAKLSIHANSNETNTTLFTIASSTASATTTLFTVLNTGNVGIGTAAPLKALQVIGDIRVGTSGTNGCIENFAGTALTGVCSSDVSLKTNIQPMGSVLSDLTQLVPSTFYWNDIAGNELHNSTTTLNYGLIAQDVARVLPGMVATTTNGYLGVNYSMLPILTLQGLKELDLNMEGLASTTAATVDMTGSKTFVGRFFDRITGWFADAANGIGEFFANRVHTKTLCVGDKETGETCITKDQLDTLLSGKTNSSSTSTTVNTATTTPPIIISINGNNPAMINVGDTYGDLGALITSPESAKNFGIKASLDGGADIDVSQISIDTTVAGSHKIVYSVVDQNNATTTAERVVNVVALAPTVVVSSDTATTTTTQ